MKQFFRSPWYLVLGLTFLLFRPNLPAARAQASQQAVSWTDTFTSATAGSDHSQFPTVTSGNPITSWIVWYYTNGSPSSVSIQLEGAADSGGAATGSYTALTAATTPSASANPATGTSEGIIRACCDYYPHIRVNVTTLSGGTSPTVTVRVFGYYGTIAAAGGGGGGGGGTIANTTNTLKGDGSGNAVAVTGTGTNCVLVNGSSSACSSTTGNAASIVTYTPAASVTLTCPSSTAGTVTIFDPNSTALAANMAVSFSTCTPGQVVILRVLQAASGGPFTVSGLPSGSPQISPYPSTTTIYLLHAATTSTVTFDNVAGDSGPGVVTEIAAPSTAPPTGDGYVYGDSTNHVLSYKAAAGTVSNTAVPQSCTGTQAFTALSAAGTFTCSSSVGTTPGMVGPLEEHTASNSASLAFTSCISASYVNYLIVFQQIIPVTAGAFFQLRFSTNGGTSYDSGSTSYGYTNQQFLSSATFNNSASASAISLASTGVGTGTVYGTDGEMHLFNPAGSASGPFPHVLGQIVYENNGASLPSQELFAGWYMGAAGQATNAFEFFFTPGNIASGTIRCYGLTN